MIVQRITKLRYIFFKYLELCFPKGKKLDFFILTNAIMKK